jgi:hypothetical protein
MGRRTVLAVTVCAPSAAFAHASDRAVILTLPTEGFIWGAGAIVALTAIIAGLTGRTPAFAAREIFVRPRLLPEGLASWLSAFFLFALIATGFLGTSDPYANPLPLWIWTVVWVGLVAVQAVIGDLWADLSPWSGPVRSLRALLGRTGSIGLARLGHWPATVGLIAFAWFEIVSLSPDDPAELALIMAVYWLVIFTLSTLEGEGWLGQGEFMTVFMAKVALIAPFWSEPAGPRLRVMTGLPGARIARADPLPPSAIAFVMLMIASVSFDGLHETFHWVAAIGLNPLDYPGRSAVTGVNTAGLLATWALMAVLILLAIRLTLALAGAPGGMAGITGPLALSFLPIAAGYHIAHYLTALLTQGQYAVAALSDPLHRGDDWLGLGPHWVGFGFLSQEAAVWRIWIVQCAIILAAHVIAVLLARRIAGQHGLALSVLAELPLTLLMVLYTSFGLWLLAAPAIG